MSQQQENNRTADPYGSYLFTVEISSEGGGGSGTVVGCSEVSGLVFETEVETLKVGGMIGGDLQLAGASKAATRLVLKRGLADRSLFWTWYLEVANSEIKRKTVTISMMNAQGETTPECWSFKEACPVKWTGPDLRAATSAVGFESIELIHKGLQPPAAG